MSEEITIFEKDTIKVTNLRAVIDAKTYSISNISAVEARRIEPSGCMPAGLTISGIFVLLFSLTNIRDLVPLLITGALLLFIGIGMLRQNKPQFAVQISTSSGEVKAYSSPNKEEIDQIVNALNEAIIKKG